MNAETVADIRVAAKESAKSAPPLTNAQRETIRRVFGAARPLPQKRLSAAAGNGSAGHR